MSVKEIDAADALDAVLNAMRNAEAKLGWSLRVRQGVAELRRLHKENAELRQRAEAAEKERDAMIDRFPVDEKFITDTIGSLVAYREADGRRSEFKRADKRNAVRYVFGFDPQEPTT